MTLRSKKRVILIAILLGMCSPIFAQTAAVQGSCDRGATAAQVSGLNSTNYLQGVIPSCLITPYLTGTTTLAPYSLSSGGPTQTGPFTANALGSQKPGGWLFYASTSAALDVVASGGIPPNVYAAPIALLTDYTPGGGGGGGGGGSGTPVQSAYFPTTNAVAGAPGSAVIPTGASTTFLQYTNSKAFSNQCEYNIAGGGQITKIAAEFMGYGYTSVPSVTISGGGGTGLAVTPVLGGVSGSQVVSYTITNAGSGYTSCPQILVAVPPSSPNPISVVDYRQGPNATQAVNNVVTFGAKCDGTTDDTLAIQAAIYYATSLSTVSGAISFPPGARCFVGTILSGYQKTGWDDGTPPSTGTCANRNAANGIAGSTCTQLPPEVPGYIGYALNASSSNSGQSLTIYGNGATIVGPFNPIAAAGTGLGMLDLPLTPGTLPSPYFSLFGGTQFGFTIHDLNISGFFTSSYALVASDQNWTNINFSNMGPEFIYSNAQASSWSGISTFQTASGPVLGGLWSCGNVTSGCVNGPNLFDAATYGIPNAGINYNGLNFSALSDFITAKNNLNTWFDNFFYHTADQYGRLSDQESALLTPGGCSSTECLTDYVGIYGVGYSEYSRYGRPQVNLTVQSINNRSSNGYEVVMTYGSSPTVTVGSGETASVCNNNGSIPYGGASCPDLYNYSWNTLLCPVYMWGQTANPQVAVSAGGIWSTCIAGPTNVSDAFNGSRQVQAGFLTTGGSANGRNDASFYQSRSSASLSGNNYFGAGNWSISGSGKGIGAQFNGYNNFTGQIDDDNLYLYDIITNFQTGGNSHVSSAQVGISAPGIRISSEDAEGSQGGNLTFVTVNTPGTGYPPLTTGSLVTSGCIIPPTATYFINSSGTIFATPSNSGLANSVKVTYGGYGCTAANPPVLSIAATGGEVAPSLTPTYNAMNKAGILSSLAAQRFNFPPSSITLAPGQAVQVTAVGIPGIHFGGGVPPYQASVPFMVYEPGTGGFTGLTYRAVATGIDTATVTIENNTSGSLTTPTGLYAAIWAAAAPTTITTAPAASGTIGTIGPKFVIATTSSGMGTMTGSGTTATHTFATAFTATPNCQATPTSNAGAYFISTQNTTTLTVTYVTSGAQTFDALCFGSGGAW